MDSFQLNCVREFVAEFPTTDWQDYGEGGIGAMQTFIRDLLDQHDADQREIARLRASVGDAVTVWEQSATRMYKRLRCVLGGALRYRKRIKALKAKLRDISEHAIIENPETPFERGYNDGTFMACQIARDALKGGE